MNLAVHQLNGQVIQANSYYEDPFESVGNFDYVMANPPFNVDKIDMDRIKANKERYPFGVPSADNGNFIWIQMFYSALNSRGKAGFVMSNTASSARSSEQTIRKKLINTGSVDVMITVGAKFFFTVSESCTLWFLDKTKMKTPCDTILFRRYRNIRTLDRHIGHFRKSNALSSLT